MRGTPVAKLQHLSMILLKQDQSTQLFGLLAP